MTRDEAFAACRALGLSATDCADNIASSTLPDGTFCDGDIVRTLDANGRPVARCVTRAQIDRKLGLAVVPPRPSSASSPSPIVLLAAAAGLAAVVYFATR